MEIILDVEAKHYTLYIVQPSVEENIYVVGYINYTSLNPILVDDILVVLETRRLIRRNEGWFLDRLGQ